MKKKRITDAASLAALSNNNHILVLGNELSKISAYDASMNLQGLFFYNTHEGGTTTYYFKLGTTLNTSVRLYITSIDHNSVRLEAQTLDVIISSQGVNLMKHHVVSKSKGSINIIGVKYGIVSGEQYVAITAIGVYNKLFIKAETHPYTNTIEAVASVNTTGFTQITL